jgi:hypothetical protein
MDGLTPGARGAVGEVSDADTIALDSKTYDLAGLYGYEKRGWLEEEAFAAHRSRAEAQRSALERMTLGRQARIGRSEGAERVHLFVQSEGGRWIWVQEALVREGAAFALPAAGDESRARKLLAAEETARQEARGAWADKAFAIRDAGRPKSIAVDRFQIVEGVVTDVAVRERYTYLNFGDDYETDFTVRISADDVSSWPEGVESLKALAGASLRVRGFVFERGGPLMDVADPGAIERRASPN